MHIVSAYFERSSHEGPDGSRTGITIALDADDRYADAQTLAWRLLWPDPLRDGAEVLTAEAPREP